MNLVIISDTHGNLMLMERALIQAQSLADPFHVIHLGDDWDDKQYLERLGYAVSGVPGLWCAEYHRPHIPKGRLDVFDGLRIAYAHTCHDLPPLTPDVHLVLCGHTHAYGISRHEGIPFMNPGHLKRDRDRGHPATFGLVRRHAETLHLSIHDASGVLVLQEKLPLPAPTSQTMGDPANDHSAC